MPETVSAADQVASATAAADTPILRLEDAALTLRDNTVLNGINLNLRRGEFAYLIGSTGAGKSSLLRLVYADMQPTRGDIWVENFQVNQLTARQIPFLRRRLGIVFQDFQLFDDRNVSNNLEFVLRATGWRAERDIMARITDVLMMVGLSSKMKHFPHQLSGGEKQRVAIARALLNDPILLLADEPTGNLDPVVTKTIMEILQKVSRTGTTVLMATHELSLLEQYPGRVLELSDGRLQEKRAR